MKKDDVHYQQDRDLITPPVPDSKYFRTLAWGLPISILAWGLAVFLIIWINQ